MTEDPRQITAIENLAEHLKSLHRERFFGTVAIQFKEGRIGLVRQEKTILPEAFGVASPNGKTEREG